MFPIVQPSQVFESPVRVIQIPERFLFGGDSRLVPWRPAYDHLPGVFEVAVLLKIGVEGRCLDGAGSKSADGPGVNEIFSRLAGIRPRFVSSESVFRIIDSTTSFANELYAAIREPSLQRGIG